VIEANQPGDGSYDFASAQQHVVTLSSTAAPANTPPANTPPASTPPRRGSASVGHVSVSGSSVRVAVNCSGGSSCTIKLTISVVETLRRGKVTAIAASAKAIKKTVVVGSKSVTIAAGKSETVTLSLNRSGKRLLARHNPLKTKLALSASGKTIAHFTITFKKTTKKK
jgi:hypothetical protein